MARTLRSRSPWRPDSAHAMLIRGLRIAIVGPLPPPAGGMALQTLQLADLLRQEGATVDILQTNTPYRPGWIGGLPGLRAVARLLPYIWMLLRRLGQYDVVHVMANSGWSWHLFAAPAIWIAWLRDVPAVVNYRGGEAAPFLDRSSGVVRRTLSRAKALVVPSGFLKEVFAHHGMQASIVPNIVDLQRFRPGARAEGPPRLLVARNLEPLYGNETALRAMALVRARRPARLVIAGTGPEEGRLRTLAVELGIDADVDFAGRLDRDEMARLLRGSHVALNPSRVDNMPNSLLEALASGVPVVSTDVGGVPFLVEHERTALLVPSGDPQAMAAAVLRVLDEPGVAERLSQAGLQEVQRYAWPRVAPLWAEQYRACLRDGRPSVPA